MPHDSSILVYGPAYLDIILRVAEPLADPALDGGSDAELVRDDCRSDSLTIRCPNGSTLTITNLDPDQHPTGTAIARHDCLPNGYALRTAAAETSLDLGGMGAGFAAALGGRLVSAIPARDDAAKAQVLAAIRAAGIDHRPVAVDVPNADRTIIVSSGPHGDKLPLGLRGCHAAMTATLAFEPGVWGIVVAASLQNDLLAHLLKKHPHSLRVLAPTSRNCRDREIPIGSMADSVDLLVCNVGEWDSMNFDDRKAWQSSAAILSITDGPNGGIISYWSENAGTRISHHEPAFPRSVPPVDTNRAGEAYAAGLVRGLVERGWSIDRRTVAQRQIREAAHEAAAAAGLVIGMAEFGFPDDEQVSAAIRAGKIEANAGGMNFRTDFERTDEETTR
jgi:ribokinase